MTTGTTQLRKRFYEVVSISETVEHHVLYRVLLDGRPVRTPAKRDLAVPSRPIAEALAGEWQAQSARVDPRTMPLTRLVNSAIDGVAGREPEVRADLLAHAGSDLLCYLADQPKDLAERQSRRWGAIHTWAKQAHGIELVLAAGVMPVAQPPAMIARVDAALGETSPLELAALHVITTLTGSALLALAVRHGRIGAEDAWSLAHLDNDYQIEKWGEDAEAAQRRQHRWTEMEAASRMLAWCTSPASR